MHRPCPLFTDPLKVLFYLTPRILSVITSSFGPRRKHLSFVVFQSFPWQRVCLRRGYSATAGYTCLLRICCSEANVFRCFFRGRYPVTFLHASGSYECKTWSPILREDNIFFISNQKLIFLWTNLLALELFAPLNGETWGPSPKGGTSIFLLYWWLYDGEVAGINGFGRRNRNLPRRHFVHHKSHLPDPGGNPGRRGGKPATNRFSYGAAQQWLYVDRRETKWRQVRGNGIMRSSVTFTPSIIRTITSRGMRLAGHVERMSD
jgi:hypothetical protein